MKVYVPLDATDTILASGRAGVPGETFDLSAEEAKDPHNKRLLDEGHILAVEPKAKKKEDGS
jgi:hypothetical protein